MVESLSDRFGRRINYLRISVTDRCNLRCRYCMPEEGVESIPHSEVLSFEEITEFVRVAAGYGVDKVRLTGGEPLVRKHVVALVKMLSQVEGVRDLSLTTNGILLPRFVRPLREAGLHRLNISLDTLDPARYRELTRGGSLQDALGGIEAARLEGFPIKINCVITESREEPDARSVLRYGEEHGFSVRFIRRMDLRAGTFYTVEGGLGGNCPVCNRLRLTANGLVYPCLFSDLNFSVRQLGPLEALRRAVAAKPESGKKSLEKHFFTTGG